MAEVQAQDSRVAQRWSSGPARAAGLYGELAPLPAPDKRPTRSAIPIKPKAGSLKEG